MWRYRLTKLPSGPTKEGSLSQSLKESEVVGWIFGIARDDGRPTVGEQLLVGYPFRVEADTPSARITSPVVRIISGEPNRIVFETASGSVYEWSRFEPS